MITDEIMIEIERTTDSKLNSTDFNNLQFGRVFSDHMFYMDYKDGKWLSPKIVPFQNMSITPAASSIHYGQAIFEGMKAHESNGELYFFRPDRNIERFNESAIRMCMPTVDKEVFMTALKELAKIDRNWIPKQEGASLYFRPFMMATDEYIGVRASESYRMVIFTCPVSTYYSGAVKVKVETEYTRAAPGGTGAAKSAGNYAGSLYPAKLAQDQGYHQLLWTDAVEHKWIEESGTMNIVFKSGNTVFSPPPSDTILDGITRDCVMTLAKDWGYNVEYRKISVEEIKTLLDEGKLDEAFGAGTAATVAPISLIGFKDEDRELPSYDKWELAPRLAREIDKIKRNLTEDTHSWIVKV